MILKLKYFKNFNILFILSIVFPWAMLKHIWGIYEYSKFINTLLLLLFIFFSYYAHSNLSINKKFWQKYIFPSFLVFIGLLINLSNSVFGDFNNISLIGMLIPWAINIGIPYFIVRSKVYPNKLWKIMNIFLTIIITLGLYDYYDIYILGNGVQIETPYGSFIAGNFSILYDLGAGIPHFRFYSIFQEPGSLAMFVIPFIVYSIFYKKYFSILIYLTAIFLSSSLGGYISLVLTFFLIYFKNLNIKKILLFVIVIPLIFIFKPYEFIINEYNTKNDSATIREDNFIEGIKNIPTLIFNRPFGLKYSTSTDENLKNKLYVGSNFMVIDYLQKGGILSFLGYLMILFYSLSDSLRIFYNKYSSNPLYLIIAISLISTFPFIVQRTTIWESVLFGWLYLPVLYNYQKKYYKKSD